MRALLPVRPIDSAKSPSTSLIVIEVPSSARLSMLSRVPVLSYPASMFSPCSSEAWLMSSITSRSVSASLRSMSVPRAVGLDANRPAGQPVSAIERLEHHRVDAANNAAADDVPLVVADRKAEVLEGVRI